MIVRVLIGCECSGVIRDAFIARGHDAWSCDLKPTERTGPHIEGDLLEVLDDGWGNLEGPIDGKIRGTHVCSLEQTDDGRIFANARLIAAAPDLLAACEAAYEELYGYADSGQSNKAGHLCEMLRAAIAKATKL